MTTVLITGSTGQVGWELQRSLAALGKIAAPDRAGMDLSDPDSIVRAIRGSKPEIIVNAAAYTAVDKAESEAALAMRVNGEAPGIMAGEAKRIGALLVHYSTDYVFDGAKSVPYVESDRPNPVNSYGRSKLAGEAAIRGSGAPHLIFRTSWVYAARGNNFVRTMLRLARERDELRIVNDQAGAPTSAKAIAEMTARVLKDAARARENGGLYHFTAAGSVSWFGFAEAIFAEAKKRFADFKPPRLVPIPSSEYPVPARRPANSRLDCSKLAATFGIAPPSWDAALKQCMDDFRETEIVKRET